MLKSPCRNCAGSECEELYPECSKVCPKISSFRRLLFGEVTLTGNAWSQAECIITI